MAGEESVSTGFAEYHRNEIRGRTGRWLFRDSYLLNAPTVVEVVHNSERELIFEKPFTASQFKHTVQADSTDFFASRDGDSLQPDTVLVLARLKRLLQVILLPSENYGKEIFLFFDKYHGKVNFLSYGSSQADRTDGFFSSF